MIDYNALAAWSALAASIIAIIALVAESRRSRFAMGIDLLLRFDESFGGDRMRNARRTAAELLLTGQTGNYDQILDFFEVLGLLTRRGALDETLVWHSFFYWIHRYFLAINQYIAEARAEDPTLWKDLVRLHSRLVSIERRERRCSDSELKLSPQQLKEFLEEESQL